MSDKARILIVDENEATLSATARVLSEAGYEVREARTGSECLELVVGLERPDVVLIEAVLTDMEGTEVCRRIKGDAQLTGTFVILVSGVHTDSDKLANGLTAGADGYILRPVGNRELLARVEAIVRIKAAEDALRQSQARERHLNAVLRSLRNVNKLITKEVDRDRLIQRACENLTETLGYKKAWTVLVNADGQVTATGSSGFDKSFTVFHDWLCRRRWPRCALNAFATRSIVVTRDSTVECGDCPLADTDKGHARLCTQLRFEDRIYGILCVCVPAQYTDDEEERELFHELASDIAFALHKIEMEKQRLAAQKALAESEDRYRALFENAPVGIFQTTSNGRTLRANPQVARMVGANSPEEAVAHFTDLSHQIYADPGRRDDFLRLLAENGEVRDFEYEAIRLDGEHRWLSMSARISERHPDGTFVIDGFTTDVTERRRAEEALRESEALLNRTQKMAHIGSWRLDLEKGGLYWSDEVYRIFGIEPQAFAATYEAFVERLHPDDRQAVDAAYRRAVKNKEPYDIVHRILRPDGEIRIVHEKSEDITDASGRVVLSIGMVHDVTESKRAEEALRESAEKLQAIVDNLGIGIALISPNMEVLEMNRQLREWFPQVNPGDRPICYLAFNDPPREGVCHYCPAQLTLKDGLLHEAITETPQGGGIRNYRILSSAIRDAEGKIAGAIEIVEDISDRQQLEAQLHQAQKMEAVGRLAGGVAHDFNNMLSVILGYTDIILSKLTPVDPLYKDMKEIRGAAERSANLTRQLLAFSRRQTIAPEVIDLNQQLKAMGRLLHRILGEDIQMEFLLSPDLWPIRMDPAQIDQIVANLAVNSRDAMPDGGWLSLETANVVLDEAYCSRHIGFKPGMYVLLAVSDSGCGMDKKTLEHIFEPFFTTKGPGKGTGLGLATVYGIVKQNNGFINVYSEPGQGTTLKVYIPMHVGGEEASRIAVGEKGPAGGTETILLAEDEEQLRRLVKTILERSGYTVIDAAGPGEAIVACEKHSSDIHLLLTDVVMPAMNGSELEHRIRNLRPNIKALFMSGYTSNAIAHHGVLDRGVHFLQKPFTREMLLKKVRKVLDGK